MAGTAQFATLRENATGRIQNGVRDVCQFERAGSTTAIVPERHVTIDQGGVGLRIEESRVARELRRLGMSELAVERAVASGLGLTPAEVSEFTARVPFVVDDRSDEIAVVEAEIRSLRDQLGI